MSRFIRKGTQWVDASDVKLWDGNGWNVQRYWDGSIWQPEIFPLPTLSLGVASSNTEVSVETTPGGSVLAVLAETANSRLDALDPLLDGDPGSKYPIQGGSGLFLRFILWPNPPAGAHQLTTTGGSTSAITAMGISRYIPLRVRSGSGFSYTSTFVDTPGFTGNTYNTLHGIAWDRGVADGIQLSNSGQVAVSGGTSGNTPRVMLVRGNNSPANTRFTVTRSGSSSLIDAYSISCGFN